MPRCPSCHRRVAPASTCARDGSLAPALDAHVGQPDPPCAAGIKVTALLGAGAFGSVWEAVLETPAGGHEPVAVKVSHSADSSTVARFRREAAVLASMGPPHVPALFASDKLADGRFYLAMERLHGRTLADEIAAFADPPSMKLVARIGGALLESAAALHRQVVYHRDLKPENVFLVGADGEPPVAKLLDFGLALTATLPTEARTSTGMAVGTPEYMAPERIAGQDGDLRSDVYALGVMLFELVTLRPPFVGEARQVEYAHLSFRPPRPSQFAAVPEPVEAVIVRCLAKQPERRFADAVEVHAAFLDAVTVTGITRETPPAPGAKAAVPPSARQQAALIFIHDPRGSAMDLQALLEPFGGQLAHLSAGRGVCAFTYRAGDHPGQRAVAGAQALAAAGLARRLIVDVGPVTVRARPNSLPRVSSPLFSQASCFPTESDPETILLTAAARETMPAAACEPSDARPDHFVLISGDSEERFKTLALTARDTVGVMFGRDQDLRVLLAEARGALAEKRPRVASVIAEQGLGKTRLRFELASRFRAEMPDAEVIELSATEALGQDADEALAQLLRRAAELPVRPPADSGRELLMERLGETATEAVVVGLLLGWIPPDDAAVRSLLAAPGVLRTNAARAGMAALRRLAARRPVLVLLDDAHWADDALLEGLEQATVSELPLWICAFARPAFTSSRPGWGQRAASAHTHRLPPLDRTSAAELCRHLLEPAMNVPEPIIDRVIDRTQAVPLLIHDLIRGLRREGLVRQQPGGVWVVATEILDRLSDFPLTQWLANRELDELPADLADHARLVSLLSTEFTLEEVEGVMAAMDSDLLDAFPIDALVGTERLEQTGMLVRRGTERLTFRTEVMHEAVAGTTSEALAGRVHRAALAYYRTALLPGAIRLSRVARHAAAVGERAEAAVAYLALAEAAREQHRYLEAEVFYTRTLTQLDGSAEESRLRAFKGRGIMRYRLGRYDDALADLALAQEIVMRGSDAANQADVLLDEAMALDWLLEWRRSRDLAERARERVPAGAPPALEARVLLALGRSLQRFNQDGESVTLLREAARLAEQAGDECYEVQVVAGLMLGFVLPFLGIMDEAEERLRVVELLCQKKVDEMHLAALWNNRSCLWIARNDRDRFQQDNARVLEYARRMGHASLAHQAHFNSSIFLYWRGEFDASLLAARRLIEIDERYFHQGGFRPDGAVLQARILWSQGAEAEARKVVQEVHRHQAEARARGHGDLLLPPNEEMLLDMTTLLLEGGDVARWDDLVLRAQKVAQGQELLEVLELAGVAALRRHDTARAARWWQEALQAGQRIPNVMADRIRQRLSDIARA